MTCEHCQQQMLPFLYELLDEPERQELARHLETCAACQDALKSAKEQQAQFAEAVKQPQPDVEFKAPAQPGATPASLTPAAAGQSARRFSFTRWTIAASVLGFLLAGAVGAAIWRNQSNTIAHHRDRLAQANDDLQKAQDRLHKKTEVARKDIAALEEEIKSHFNDWRKKETKLREDLQEKGAQLRVIGPQNLVAGGRNTIEVEMPQDGFFPNQNIAQQQMKNLAGMPQVQARVFDQRNQQKLTDWQQLRPTVNNRQVFNLPPDLPQPSQDIAIEFQAQTDTGAIVNFRDNLKYASPEYVTHLATDRPLYRPGDTVRFRSLTLERFSLKFAQQAFHLRYRITGPEQVELYSKEFASRVVAGKDNALVHGPDGEPLLGVGVGEFTLPADVPNGRYTLSVSEVNERFPEEKRVFNVHRAQAPASGATMQPNLPIAVGDLDVEFYPEGGDLIAGVPNRVYFQARSKANRPVDVAGRIVDDAEREVVPLQSLTDAVEPGINQGMGSFLFTPRPGVKYSLRLAKPAGIQRVFALPSAKSNGVALHVAQNVVENEIDVTLHNVKENRTFLIAAYCRGRWIGHKDNVAIKANESARVNWTLPQDVAGVYRITVFERKGRGDDAAFQPLAERLIYRKNSEHVDVLIQCDKDSYQPGQTVRLTLEARNEKKELAPTLALAAVVDRKVLKAANETTARGMPTHFLLTTEVRAPEELEHADVLLGAHPQAGQALDLLLGCQGWRRFAEQDPEVFQRKRPNAAAPIFLANSFNVSQFLENEQKEIEKLDQNYVAKAVDLQKKLGAIEKNDVSSSELQADTEKARQAVASVKHELAATEVLRLQTEAFGIQLGLVTVLLLAIFVGLYACGVGVRRLIAGEGGRAWVTLGFGLTVLLFLGSVFGIIAVKGIPIFDLDGWPGMGNRAQPHEAPEIAADAKAPQALPMRHNENLLVAAAQPLAAPDNDAPKGETPAVVRPRPDEAIADVKKQNANNEDPAQIAPDRLLRHQGQFHAVLRNEMGRRIVLPVVNDPCIVREYAHRRPLANKAVPGDFTETICWLPVLVMPNGRAEVTFDLPDTSTQFEVLILSNTPEGRLGVNRSLIVSKTR